MFDKFYYIADSNVNLNEAIKDYLKKKAQNDDLKFVVLVDEKIFLDDKNIKYKNIISNLNERGIIAEDIVVSVDTKRHSFTQQEWKRFKEISDYFKKNDVYFGFEDMDETWSFEKVEHANSRISKTAQKLKDSTLSPYEKLLFAYMKVASRKYISESEGDHYSSSRSVYGALNSREIVCVGYSEFLKAIMNEVGDENIKVYKNSVSLSKDGKYAEVYHANLIVYLKDEKYGIDGYYYMDPTWDSATNKSKIPNLSYFLIPLPNIKNMKSIIKDRSLPFKPNKVRKIKKSYSVFNRKKATKSISFNRDSLKLNSEIVADFLKNPKLFEALKEKYIKYQLSDYNVDINDVRKNIDFIKKAKEIVQDYGVQYIYSGDYKSEFEFSKIIEEYAVYQDSLRQKYAKCRSADNVKKNIDDFIADFNKETQKRIEQGLEKDKFESIKANIQTIADNLYIIFARNEKLKDGLIFIKDYNRCDTIKSLVSLACDAKQDNKKIDLSAVEERLKKGIKIEICDQNEKLEEELAHYKEQENKFLNYKQEIDNKSNAEIMQMIKNCDPKMLQDWIQQILLDTSADIDDEKLRKALREIYSGDNAYLYSKVFLEKIDENIDKILKNKAKEQIYIDRDK